MGAAEPAEAVGRLEAGAAALLPAPEGDVLAWAAHVLACGTEGGAVRYGRAVVGRGEERGGALVRCVERRGLDGLGRLTRVRRFEWSLSSILRRHVLSHVRQFVFACALERAQAPSPRYIAAIRRLIPQSAVFDATGSRGRGMREGAGV